MLPTARVTEAMETHDPSVRPLADIGRCPLSASLAMPGGVPAGRARSGDNEVEAVLTGNARRSYCISMPAALMAVALRSISAAMRSRKRTGSSTKMSP
jgi:hypothetical protein